MVAEPHCLPLEGSSPAAAAAAAAPGSGEKPSGEKSQVEPESWGGVCVCSTGDWLPGLWEKETRRSCPERVSSPPLPSGAAFSLSPVQLKPLQLFRRPRPFTTHRSLPSLPPSLLPRGKRAGRPSSPSGDPSQGCSLGSAPPPCVLPAKEP